MIDSMASLLEPQNDNHTKRVQQPRHYLSPQDAAELYGLPYWSNDYFCINQQGQLCFCLEPITGHAPLPLTEIIATLQQRGYSLPIILRFPQLLADRLDTVNHAFANAIQKFDYQAHYQGVFPIKVNQRRVVVETIATYGARYRTGLEAGSKAELAICLAQDMAEEALLCCNGFKDDDFIRMALWGKKMGKRVVITLEKFSELERVLRIAQTMDIPPLMGIRFKLHSKGSGQWSSSGGDSAKFGLSSAEIMAAVEHLKTLGRLEALVMLHCHVGSQLTDIRKIRTAVREAARAYCSLRQAGVPIQYLNVGGGLAVDYDGSKTTYYVSANYNIQEYADTVVYTILEICNEAAVPHPIIVTESGRALTAHHAIVVLPVIDVIGSTLEPVELPELEGEVHSLIADMEDILENISLKNYREAYYDAVGNKETMNNLFDLGYLSLLERAHIENLYKRILAKVAQIVATLEYVPDELEDVSKILADKYICNFSVFQSLPDHWAIQSLFPIMPLQRLNERPQRHGTLVDISCDSDGHISKFIDLRDVRSTLPLHQLNGQPYYIGCFLTGAYQDVLANSHNLFGRVNEAHIEVEDGSWHLHRFERGEKARRIIEKMGYSIDNLEDAIITAIDKAKASGTMSASQGEALLALYASEMAGYTYLEQI